MPSVPDEFMVSYNDDVPDPTGVNWYPRLAAGDFYIKDRHYYLFGEKETYTLEECTETSYDLTGYPTSLEDMDVTVEGFEYNNFTVDGNTISIRHPDRYDYGCVYNDYWDNYRKGWYRAGYGFDPTGLATITYNVEVYNTGIGIMQTGVYESFRLNEGTKSYSIPTGDYFMTPIIVTDDEIQPDNYRDYVPEYSFDPDDCSLDFNGPMNYVLNPGFCAWRKDEDCLQPLAWDTLGYGTVGLLRMPDAYYGKYVAYIDATGVGTGIMAGYEQSVYLEPGAYTASAYMRKRPNCTNAIGRLEFGTSIQEEVLTTDWYRLYTTFTASGTTSLHIGCCGEGQVEIDAVQVESGSEVSEFAFASPHTTLEAESNPTGIYTAGPIDPYTQDAIDVDPLNAKLPRGFLSIGEYPKDEYDEPKYKGGCMFE